MTRTTPPSPTELFQQYLRGQADAQAQGLGYVEPAGDVVPHDAAPTQPIDPKQAWADARAVLEHFAGLPKVEWPVPPDWAALVTNQEPAVALPFCIGNTPQLVRELQSLLAGNLIERRSAPSPESIAPAARDWAHGVKDYPHLLLAAAVLRLAGDFDRAAELLQRPVPVPWRAVHGNEEAALLWQRGQTKLAAERWAKLEPSVPTQFNRGMSALCLGDASTATAELTAAVAMLPESSPWHHLGQLYLALASERA